MVRKLCSLSEAIKLIKDGDQIMLGGWTVVRKPMGAVYEIIRQKKRRLHITSGTPGTDNDLLVGAGCVEITEGSYVGHEVYGHPYNFRRAVEQQQENYFHDDSSVLTSWLRVLAAAMGVPFIPTVSLRGSDLLNPNYDTLKDIREANPKLPQQKFVHMEDPFWGQGQVTLLPAVKPDVFIMHAQEASEDGTVRVSGPAFGDYISAMAAKTTIVTAENIVPNEELRNIPELNTVPGVLVDAVVELPYGAHPTALQGHYDNDPYWYKEYTRASKTEEDFLQWLDEWVTRVPTHEDYLMKLGKSRLDAIKADKFYGYNEQLKRRVDNI